MTGPKPTISLDQYRRLLEVRELRRRAPCNKVLARELGVPMHAVANAIARGIKRYDYELAKEVKP